MSTRRKQIKKCGAEYVLYSVDGKKVLGRSKSIAGAEAIARRVYGSHGGKRKAGGSRAKPTRRRVKRR